MLAFGQRGHELEEHGRDEARCGVEFRGLAWHKSARVTQGTRSMRNSNPHAATVAAIRERAHISCALSSSNCAASSRVSTVPMGARPESGVRMTVNVSFIISE